MGTKLSSPGSRRNHHSSVTTNDVQRRGRVPGRSRARSLQTNDSQSMTIPTRALQRLDISSEDNSPSPDGNGGALLQARSLPGQLFALHGLRCPVCSKFVPTDEVELHFVICLTKPRLVYNDDVLSQDAGECVICLDDLLADLIQYKTTCCIVYSKQQAGDKIARLPCLCIYHKRCIDMWFQKNRSCPEHPS